MEKEKTKTSAELLAERKWTEFLRKIPVGRTDWRIENYRDFVSLKVVASILGGRDDYNRRFSFQQDKEDNTIYYITVTEK